MKRIYLACPYTDKDPHVVDSRVYAADIIAGVLMEKGCCVFSPLSHSHPIAAKMKRDNFDHNFWLNQDLPFLVWADIMVVLGLTGWRESKGISREIVEARALGKPVRLIKETDVYRLLGAAL